MHLRNPKVKISAEFEWRVLFEGGGGVYNNAINTELPPQCLPCAFTSFIIAQVKHGYGSPVIAALCCSKFSWEIENWKKELTLN